MTSKALVGPLPTITFGGGPRRGLFDRERQAYTPPRYTGDPRYRACTTHHPACDCREAEFAEEITELRHQLRTVREAAEAVLRGHRHIDADADYTQQPGAFDFAEYNRLLGVLACQCTGCQIVRRSDLIVSYDYRTGVIE